MSPRRKVSPRAVLDYAALLRASMDRSGLSRRAYAETVLVRDERSVRRWVAGDPMPKSVRAFLERELRALADTSAVRGGAL